LRLLGADGGAACAAAKPIDQPRTEITTMVYRTATLPPLFTLRREMDRLLEDAVGRGEAGVASWVPAADVREDEAAYLFELDLPGVSPEAVELTIESGVLTVRGEKRNTREGGDPSRTHVAERLQGTFRRAFPLPKDVAEERIEATFTSGLLTVRLPKVERPKARRIEINS